MTIIFSSYLQRPVELTDERKQHIVLQHPDLVPDYIDLIVQVIEDPDEVRSDTRFPNTQLFSRWFADLKQGKFVVVVIVSDSIPVERLWIVTAYIARRLTQGVIQWKRN